jgi:hypothetical protein
MKLRRVMVSERYRDEVTRRLDIRPKAEALFHGWGSASTESDTGFGNDSVAIVEFANGTVDTVEPILIRFLDSADPEHKKGET